MKKIAIFGGAFDPPTIGHLQILNHIILSKQYDEVWMMPAYSHTFNKNMTGFNNRFDMCLMIAKDYPKITISNYEFFRQHMGGTLELFTKLQEDFPGYDFTMIIGTDNGNIIDKWKDYEILITRVKFLVISRPGYDKDENCNWYLRSPHKYVEIPNTINISSTKIRNEIEEGNYEILDWAVTSRVKKYIIEKRLYH